ncbi:MAG TPA: S41 family peptidase [Thermoanaerobaculia bacterium]|jgi:C-terminal processing protease CtpA/Prc|nr:S41 family peptidase [Thermoanaerobaculia bacterium]
MIAAALALAVLTSTARADAVEKIAALIDENYVFEATAHRVAGELRARQASGAYDALNDPDAFAAALTADLRRLGEDEHLEVVVRRAEAAPLATPAQPDWLEPLRRRNFDFARVEIMEGNIGYLDLRSFPPPEVAGDTAAAAMEFLANADAVIIDLRRNGGGTGDMVHFLATYFFEQRTLLSRTFRRAENRTTDDRTLPYVPGRRLVKTPLFILTSRETFSAAEGFAFSLQQLGRAVIVGERTRGGANAGRYRRATELFSVFIPMAHAMAAESDKSWDRAGIQPDVPSPAAEALDVALQKAKQRPAATSLPGAPSPG